MHCKKERECKLFLYMTLFFLMLRSEEDLSMVIEFTSDSASVHPGVFK